MTLKTIHQSVTLARVIPLVESQMFGTANPGICISCGAERDGCEPDARGYPCDECGSDTVYGAEELLYLVSETAADYDAKQPRQLWQIAQEIRKTWPSLATAGYAAVPYVEAMEQLQTVDQHYGLDPARHIVRYFLSNAQHWRGEDARRIKAELKAML